MEKHNIWHVFLDVFILFFCKRQINMDVVIIFFVDSEEIEWVVSPGNSENDKVMKPLQMVISGWYMDILPSWTSPLAWSLRLELGTWNLLERDA